MLTWKWVISFFFLSLHLSVDTFLASATVHVTYSSGWNELQEFSLNFDLHAWGTRASSRDLFIFIINDASPHPFPVNQKNVLLKPILTLPSALHNTQREVQPPLFTFRPVHFIYIQSDEVVDWNRTGRWQRQRMWQLKMESTCLSVRQVQPFFKSNATWADNGWFSKEIGGNFLIGFMHAVPKTHEINKVRNINAL